MAEQEDQEIADLENELFNLSGEAEVASGSSKAVQSLLPIDLFTDGKESPQKAPTVDRNSTALAKRIGLADSSDDDDEDVDSYLSRKYNEYGSAIQQHMNKACEEKKDKILEGEVRRSINVLPSKSTRHEITAVIAPPPPRLHAINPALAAKDTTTAAPTSIFTDPIFGMKIIRPLISSALLTERMAGKKPVSSANIRTYIDQMDKNLDWVIAGAIISKSPVKTSQKGDQFSIWQISDLRGADVKTVSLFLFKGAHKELWKTAAGMVIAVLNPNVLERRSASKDEATVSVDNCQKVMILGQSKDLGKCKSKKNNGDPCGSVVNLSTCEFCIFHVRKEFGSVSKRAELQSSTAGRGLNDLRNKVLGKAEVFYAGQSYTAVPAVKSAKMVKKDQDRLLTLSEYFGTTTSAAFQATINPQNKKKVQRSAQSVELNSRDRAKDMQRLEELKTYAQKQQENDKSATNITTTPLKTKADTFTPKFSPALMAGGGAGAVPKLSQGEFTFEVSAKLKRTELSKVKAAQILKQKPIVKANPNFMKHRGTESGKKRAIDEMNDSLTLQAGTSSSVDSSEVGQGDAKRPKIESSVLTQEEVKRSRIQRIMNAHSSHMNLVDMKETEAQQKYFDTLERKEQMEEKMINTYKMPCKAVACLKCKYLAFKASDLCKEAKHPLKLMEAEKRFFKCTNCNTRTTSLHRLPKFPCSKCDATSWAKTGMMREKTVQLGSERLSIRGDEEANIGCASSKDINLDLHVADDS